MRNLRTEQEIMQHWKGDPSQPLVSVCCITYNHGPYIEDALEGFLIQETYFPIEILIHDDASTDKTPDIIRKYEAAYPNIVKPIYQAENQYSKGVKISLNFNYPRAKGKYVAFCEGDDYWIDPLKLKKQVNFLEANVDYGLVCTARFILYQNKNKIVKNKLTNITFSFFDLLIRNRITTLTVLLRKNLLLQYHNDILPETKSWKMGDYPIWLWFAKNSKIHFISDRTAVYRRIQNTMSRPKSLAQKIQFARSIFEIKTYFINKYGLNEMEYRIIQKHNANSKIKRGVRMGSYSFYCEGINEKLSCDLRISLLDRLYGIILSNRLFRVTLNKVVLPLLFRAD